MHTVCTTFTITAAFYECSSVLVFFIHTGLFYQPFPLFFFHCKSFRPLLEEEK